ncbi:MAG: shikimate dehydrogenase [Pseudomonadota bacterium]
MYTQQPGPYAVIGNPIAHSRSPAIHQAFAKQTSQYITYDRILSQPDQFSNTVRGFIAAGGKGLNVTVPFKQQAYDLADTLSAQAQAAGAVNTLVVRQDNTLHGENTDGIGLVRDLQHNHDIHLTGSRILILGAGGATRGILHPILACQPAQLIIANRSPDKARALADSVSAAFVSGCSFDQIPAEPFDLILHATAAGLSGQVPAIPAATVATHTYAYDLLYSNQPTPFLRWTAQQGAAQTIDGLGMLVEQAAAAFYLWRGIQPDTAPVLAHLSAEKSTS